MNRHRVPGLVVIALLALSTPGCGGSGSTAAADVEARVARERADAARTARQEERIRQLEREVAAAKKRPRASEPRPAPSAQRTSTSSAPTASSPPAVSSAEPGAAGDWPGGSGQTVILGSLSTENEARQLQQRATTAGLDAGVLNSSDFASLRPGYWVAFSGKFGSVESASQRQARARSLGFSDAYVRFVSP